MILTMAMAIITLLPLNAFPSRSIPVASFDASDTLIAKHAGIQFTDQSTGNPDSWAWTFDGGVPATSTDQNPVVVYPTPGVYNVTLVVSNDSGSDSITQIDYITVTEYPAGWSYTVTGTTHIISVWGGNYPTINGDSLQPGDLVGVFFTDNNDTICGGFNEWNGVDNISVVAFGDDSFTSEKDGFAIAEEFIWKVYSWCAQRNFNATATYSFGTSYFIPDGMSILSALDATGPVYYSISGEITNSLGIELADVFLCFGDSVGPTITDENGYYQRCVPSGWNDTVQPLLQGFSFTPAYRDYSNVSAHFENQDYTGSSGFLTISGFVTENSTGLEDVIITFSGGAGSDTTDSNGYYSLDLLLGWNGTAIPAKEGYSFLPPSRLYSNLTGDLANEDYSASILYFTISGLITDDGSGGGIDSALVSFTNGIDSVYSNETGFYEQQVPYDWSGIAEPSKEGYDFVPVSRSYSSVNSNHPNEDYSGIIQTFSISGTITDNDTGLGMNDVMVVFSGLSTVFTNNTGYYIQTVPYGWIGMASPNASGCSFVPEERNYTDIMNNVIDQDYVGTFDNFPPGWEYVVTPTSHIISVPLSASPKINGVSLTSGDFIGVFYYNADSTDEKCGGFHEWNGVMNIAVTAFGDDVSSPEKDGFAFGENFIWKIYDWDEAIEYEAIASYDPTLPQHDGTFFIDGLSALTTLNADNLEAVITAVPGEICLGGVSQLNSVITGGSGFYSYSWTSNPAGFISTDPNPLVLPTETTTYYLEVSTFNNIAIESKSVTVIQPPSADAGSNDTICEGNNYFILNASAMNYDSVFWTTNGDGYFSDPHIMNPVYEPGSNDVFSGSVQLSFTAFPLSPCDEPAVSTMMLYIQQAPYVEAGINDSICEDQVYQASSAYALNYSSVNWTSGGDGIFDDPTSINPTYFPGDSDIQNGMVTLTINTLPIGPCAQPAVDNMLLTITHLPVSPVSLSVDRNNICVGDPGTISLAAQGGSGDILNWYMDDCGSVLIGSGDIIVLPVPFVSTTYYARWENACGVSTCNSLTVNIIELPTVDAGPDQMIQFGDSTTLQGSASGNGYDLISFSWVPGSGLSDPSILMPSASPDTSTTYTLTVINEFGCYASDMTGITVGPPGWGVTQTPVSHIISIPLSANPNIDGEPILAGDFIGVFFEDGEEAICGGLEVWNGQASIAVIAFGDDPLTTDKDGFTTGEDLVWKIYSWSEMTEFEAVVEYDQTLPNYDGKFVPDGLSSLISLSAFSGAVVHSITIPEGWGAISSYVDPENDSVEVIFSSILADLVILQDMAYVYWPQYGINTIGEWETHTGYKIKMDNEAILLMTGEEVLNKTLYLEDGWTLMPVLSNIPVASADIFGPIGDTLVIVKEVAGNKVYWPQFGITSLDYLIPGKAYMINVTHDCSIVFPESDASMTNIPPDINDDELNNPWNVISKTPNSHAIALDNKAFGDVICQEDVIGVFGTSGLCYGLATISTTDESAVLMAYADDASTELPDGFIEGETMSFKLFRPSAGKTIDLEVAFNEIFPHTGYFVFNGISAITSFQETTFSVEENNIPVDFLIYPNPAGKNLYIMPTGSTSYPFMVSIIDMKGKVMFEAKFEHDEVSEIEVKAFPNGIYVVKISDKNTIRYKKFIKG